MDWKETMTPDEAIKIVRGPQVGTDKAHAGVMKRAASVLADEVDRLRKELLEETKNRLDL